MHGATVSLETLIVSVIPGKQDIPCSSNILTNKERETYVSLLLRSCIFALFCLSLPCAFVGPMLPISIFFSVYKNSFVHVGISFSVLMVKHLVCINYKHMQYIRRLSSFLDMSAPEEDYSRNTSAALLRIYTFLRRFQLCSLLFPCCFSALFCLCK